MFSFIVCLLIIGAYLLGAFPTSVVMGKALQGIDIREHGSGNAGATNTFRVLGKKAGWTVMAVDVFKGYTATMLPNFIFLTDHSITDNEYMILQLVCGIVAVIGHIFPVYIGFKGGKGVASLLGLAIAFNTPVAFSCVLVFLLVLIASKYVSLGSMLAALSFSVFLWVPQINSYGANPIQLGFGAFVFILVVYTHRQNVKRLLDGNENKTILFGKKE